MKYKSLMEYHYLAYTQLGYTLKEARRRKLLEPSQETLKGTEERHAAETEFLNEYIEGGATNGKQKRHSSKRN